MQDHVTGRERPSASALTPATVLLSVATVADVEKGSPAASVGSLNGTSCTWVINELRQALLSCGVAERYVSIFHLVGPETSVATRDTCGAGAGDCFDGYRVRPE